jgi:flagellar L-ring protein precursor FlgH
MKPRATLAVALLIPLSLSACMGMAERLGRIGEPPPMTTIENPVQQPGYQPVSMPMPQQHVTPSAANSLWQAGRQTFFKDQRAHKIGDILTVMIAINDDADMINNTQRVRNGTEAQTMPNMLGFESKLGKVLPDAVDPANLAEATSQSQSIGNGVMRREEEINLRLAAIITQVLPNGNFVLRGTQQVRVNHELRELTLDGVIRPEDIMNNNAVSYEKIAEARISYGGRGTISDAQQPRYGQQLFDAVFPF